MADPETAGPQHAVFATLQDNPGGVAMLNNPGSILFRPREGRGKGKVEQDSLQLTYLDDESAGSPSTPNSAQASNDALLKQKGSVMMSRIGGGFGQEDERRESSRVKMDGGKESQPVNAATASRAQPSRQTLVHKKKVAATPDSRFQLNEHSTHFHYFEGHEAPGEAVRYFPGPDIG